MNFTWSKFRNSCWTNISNSYWIDNGGSLVGLEDSSRNQYVNKFKNNGRE